MNVSILIASFGRGIPLRRTIEAYQRETPGDPQILISYADTAAGAWQKGIRNATGDVVHFTHDEVEPHPGWLDAALAAIGGKRVAAPTLWCFDGTAPAYARDWSPAVRSELPTLSRAQLRSYGIPPLTADCGAEFVTRTEYAFTLWRD